MKESIDQWLDRARQRRVQQDAEGLFERQAKRSYWDDMEFGPPIARRVAPLPDEGKGSGPISRSSRGRGTVSSVTIPETVNSQKYEHTQPLAA